MFEKIKNRKLRKLLRNPTQFVRDMHRLKPFFDRWASVSTGANPTVQQQEPVVLIAPIEPPTKALARFELVGDNWLDSTVERPIAILWGFHPWKRQFIASYLHEYRVAFARGNTPWSAQKSALDEMDSIHFVVWGMTDSQEVREYAAARGIPLLRVEDGFIRSAELGSTHSLPMSLALDRQGIYYDASRASDLEALLATHDFDADPKLMQVAASLRRVFCHLKISKYNLGSFRSPFHILGPHIKERILVIGQVDEDASIAHGLAHGWTSHRLLELAHQENPLAEIIYKPHPDVVQGYRANSDELKNLQKICRVLSEDVVMADLFQAVDRVYVITSLSGMEALLHGLPVTVVGAPFYAGWGLTDDRQTVERRQRRLTLDQLFCGVYLLYPRYLTDLGDSVVGCLAAMLRVNAQRKQRLIASVNARFVERKASWLAESNGWPLLFRPEHLEGLKTQLGKKLLSVVPVARILGASPSGTYQRSMAYFLVGQLRSTPVFPKLLAQIRTAIRPEHYAALLTDLWALQPSAALLDQWAAHSEQIGDLEAARKALVYVSGHDSQLPEGDGGLPVSSKRWPYVLKLAQMDLRQRRLDEALAGFNHLLLSGYVTGEIFAGLSEIARLQFEFNGASRILNVFNQFSPDWKEGHAHLTEARSAALDDSSYSALEAISLACLKNPQYIETSSSVADALPEDLQNLGIGRALQAAVEVSAEGGVIARAKALISHERAQEAEVSLLSYSPNATELLKYCLALSSAYSYQGKLAQAKQLVANLLPHQPSLLLYREGVRLAVLMNDYKWASELLSDAERRGLELGDMYHRKVSLGLGDLKGGYASFRRLPAVKIIKSYLPASYTQDIRSLVSEDVREAAVVAYFGPGDEIRFASFYGEIQKHCHSGMELTFTCDPRLLPLLQRGYPDLRLMPTARTRSLAYLDNYEHHDRLPGSDLHTFVDNDGWDLIRQADRVTLTTDLLGDLIDGYASFIGEPYLKADPLKAAHWRHQLQLRAGSARAVVGLSWRSSLTTYSRNEHYLGVEDLVPLFALDGVQFVNLQYDDCTDELAWLNERFPGRVVNFPELDQFNDLDGVAALMNCLDLVVAPATTVVELAGALGCPTLLLSNSSELHWRKRPGTAVDVWHRSITHVEGERLGDKASLIDNLARVIAQRFASVSTPQVALVLDSPRPAGVPAH